MFKKISLFFILFIGMFSIGFSATTDFISLWNVSIDTGLTGYNNLTLPLQSDGTYNFVVDWGDGNGDTITSWDDIDNFHIYAIDGEYIVNISGQIDGWAFNAGQYYEDNKDDGDKLIDILQWGNLKISDGGSQFSNCDNLVNFSASDILNTTHIINMNSMFVYNNKFNGDLISWDVSNVENMERMFYDAGSFNSNITNWDVSSVTNMNYMFRDAGSFNSNISNWNISNVLYMSYMFANADNFNSDLSSWDVSSVTDMEALFWLNNFFNSDLSSWDVSSVTDMSYMFAHANNFNSDLSSWNVSKVTNMDSMFEGASLFNQSLNFWDVSKVTNMWQMFSGASSFNQDLSSWDVSNVNDKMGRMFDGASSFNGNISSWNISKIINMVEMFDNAKSFNGDLSSWDVSKVTSMSMMFNNADNFNGNISSWDVSSVTDMTSMFRSADNFNADLSSWDVVNVTNMNIMFQDSGLSVENYSNILVGWSSLPSLKSDVSFGATGIDYFNSSADDRQFLIDIYNWTITDGNPIFPEIKIDYLSPIENDYFLENILITVNATNNIASCTLHWNNEDTLLSVSGNQCSITKSGYFGNSYDYNVTVVGTNSAINTTSTLTVNLVDSNVSYVSPTPVDGLNKFNLSNFTISFNDDLGYDNCIFVIGGVSYSNVPVGGFCNYTYFISESNLSKNFIEFEGFYNVSGTVTSVGKRTIKSYVDSSVESLIVPGFGVGSLVAFVVLLVFGGLF